MDGQETPTPPVPKKRGRKRIEFDLAEVERVAALGLNQAQIAEGLGISERTIARNKSNNEAFLTAIKRGQYAARQALLARLERHGEKNVIADIFRAKFMLGWQEGAQGQGASAPINVTVSINGGKPDLAPPKVIEHEHEEVE